MITFLLIIGLIILLGLNVATCIIILRQIKRIGIYEEWILEFKMDLVNTLDEMRKIDSDATFKSSFKSDGMGAFESDDEVGQVFKDILGTIEKLNDRTQ